MSLKPSKKQISVLLSTKNDGKEKLNLYGAEPNPVVYSSLLRWCGRTKSLSNGMRLHAQIIKSGVEGLLLLGNLLLQMYGCCGSLEDARELFDRMHERDRISWNFMIREYVHNGRNQDAIQLFQMMQQRETVVPDGFIFASVLSACVGREALTQGRWTHACLLSCGIESDIMAASALVNMYGKCASMEDAQTVFDKMPERNVISWNAIIAGYAHIGQAKEAVGHFEQMHQEAVMPSKITVLMVVSVCASQAALYEGKQIHDLISGSNCESDIVVRTALVNMYGKCGSLGDARKTFDEIVEHDVVSWNAMIAVYAQHGQGKEALQLFGQMQQESEIPDKVTFVNILSACASEAAVAPGKQVHAQIAVSEVRHEVAVGNALLNMYGKCGILEFAERMFGSMLDKDAISWNTMIAACAQNGQGKEAFQLFTQMQLEGLLPSKVTFVSILDACDGHRFLADGKWLHAQIVSSESRLDVAVGNALLNMYGKCGRMDDAQRMFDEMPNRDKVTFVNILSACASRAARTEGKRMHACIIHLGLESDVVVFNALVNMYAKCGRLDDAHRVFDNMIGRNVVSWTTIIVAYSQHGQGKYAIQLFEQMLQERVEPNKVTFVNVLSACSHTGLVEEGHHYFRSMKRKHGISPAMDHYNCMIDLLGRAGRLEEAEEMLNSMPFQPGAVAWMTLLGACRKQFDVGRAEHAARHVFELDPEKVAPYVMLSHIYAAAGREDDAHMIMSKMRGKGLKKEPGCSSIEVKGKVHEFFADDQSHPQKEEIYAELQRLTRQINEAGHNPDLLHEYESEEKEDKLCGHSERLAIAFGLISTPDGSPLLITKNLRVCPDCHAATKFITKISHREIVMRDAIRFHHVKDGICSCADYW